MNTLGARPTQSPGPGPGQITCENQEAAVAHGSHREVNDPNLDSVCHNNG
jgi:hypothetical protein